MLLENSHNKLLNNSNSKHILLLGDGRLFRPTHATSPGSATLQEPYKVNCWFLACWDQGDPFQPFGLLETSPTHFALVQHQVQQEDGNHMVRQPALAPPLHWVHLWIQMKALTPVVLPVRFMCRAIRVYIHCKSLMRTIKQLHNFAVHMECTWKGDHTVVPPTFAMQVLWRL